MSRDTLPVLVTTATESAVSVFLRNGDGALVQTGQLAVAGVSVDPATLASLTADLADTFGWSAVPALANGHAKKPKALPRAKPAESDRSPSHPAVSGKVAPDDYRKRPRRGHAAMAALREAVLAVLVAVPDDRWLTTTDVHTALRTHSGLEQLHDSGTRKALAVLHAAGRVHRAERTMANGKVAYSWRVVR